MDYTYQLRGFSIIRCMVFIVLGASFDCPEKPKTLEMNEKAIDLTHLNELEINCYIVYETNEI